MNRKNVSKAIVKAYVTFVVIACIFGAKTKTQNQQLDRGIIKKRLGGALDDDLDVFYSV